LKKQQNDGHSCGRPKETHLQPPGATRTNRTTKSHGKKQAVLFVLIMAEISEKHAQKRNKSKVVIADFKGESK
jgi:hypothetical protein